MSAQFFVLQREPLRKRQKPKAFFFFVVVLSFYGFSLKVQYRYAGHMRGWHRTCDLLLNRFNALQRSHVLPLRFVPRYGATRGSMFVALSFNNRWQRGSAYTLLHIKSYLIRWYSDSRTHVLSWPVSAANIITPALWDTRNTPLQCKSVLKFRRCTRHSLQNSSALP